MNGERSNVLDIDDVHPLRYCPFDSSIDIVNNVAVVLCDVILDVDNDQCFCLHINNFISLTLQDSYKRRQVSRFSTAKLLIVADSAKYLGYSAHNCDE